MVYYDKLLVHIRFTSLVNFQKKNVYSRGLLYIFRLNMQSLPSRQNEVIAFHCANNRKSTYLPSEKACSDFWFERRLQYFWAPVPVLAHWKVYKLISRWRKLSNGFVQCVVKNIGNRRVFLISVLYYDMYRSNGTVVVFDNHIYTQNMYRYN